MKPLFGLMGFLAFLSGCGGSTHSDIPSTEQQTISSLVESPARDTGGAAARELSQGGTPGVVDVAALIKGLGDPQPRFRLSAIRELEKISSLPAFVIPPLTEVLKDDSPSLRADAARLLGRTDWRAISPLLNALVDEEKNVSRDIRASLWSLCQQQQQMDSAGLVLIDALTSPSVPIRKMAMSMVYSYSVIDRRNRSKLLKALQDVFLNDSDSDLRSMAAAHIASMSWHGGDGGVVPPSLLVDILKRADTYTSMLGQHQAVPAAEALVNMGETALPTVPALIEAFTGGNAYLASYTLVGMGSKAAPYLLRALDDSRDPVRLHAALALVRMKSYHVLLSAEDVIRLISIVHPAGDLQVDVTVLDALGRYDAAATRPAFPHLLEYSFHPNCNIRYTAAHLIGRMGSSHVARLLDELKDTDLFCEIAVELAAEGIGYDSVFHALRNAARHPRVDVRLNAMNGLGHLGGERAAVTFIRTLDDDSNERVREAAFDGWCRLDGSISRNERGLSLLVASLGDRNRRIRELAFDRLRGIGDMAMPALRRGLRQSSLRGRINSAFTLYVLEVREREMLPPLAEALEYDVSGEYTKIEPTTEERSFRVFIQAEPARIRTQAAYELGEMGETSAPAIPGLVKALQDTSPFVRQAAATALRKIGIADDQVIRALKVGSRDPNHNVRTSSYLALKALGVSIEMDTGTSNEDVDKEFEEEEDAD